MVIKTTKISSGYWQVTIDNPPINIFDQSMVEDLQFLTDQLEKDDDVKIVVFESADPEFFISHIDIAGIENFSFEPGPTGLTPWPDLALRWAKAPFVTVGVVRGRARGVGSEFLQALDIRFASRERAILSQIEVGTGVIPGGGGLERLPPLIGRARALEVLLGAEDFDADTAERYGWVNRAIPDSELNAFVENFAGRVSSFDKQLISTIKEIVNQRVPMPKTDDLVSSQTRFFEIANRPETQARLGSFFERGLQTREFELNLPEHLALQEIGTPRGGAKIR